MRSRSSGRGRLRGDGLGLWLDIEAAQHLRRGDPPAQPVARRLEDAVGVFLVGASHGQAPAQQLHGEGLWAGVGVGSGIGLEAPVQHLEHLELDAGEQCRVDVENFLQCVLELPGMR